MCFDRDEPEFNRRFASLCATCAVIRSAPPARVIDPRIAGRRTTERNAGVVSVRITIVGVNTFEVGENDLSVEVVAVRHRVVDDSVRDLVLVIASELGTAPMALLLVTHDQHSR